ncbi:MAG TPA: ISL3 family transposase [Anaeromyxobacteraceae bacterium]|nr:ISL3 family transposase [Anaeromyxobacteraceae bacterium]
MRVTTVFNKLLSLQGAFVRRVVFGPNGIVVDVAKRHRRNRCPRCTFSTPARYDRTVREWRHLSLGKWRVVIRATLCRLVCPEHGVVTEAVPWAEHDSRFTRDFEDLVAWVAREMNKTAVKNLLHIAWATVGNIIERVVARKIDRARLDELYRIGIDEVSYRKGHKYLTVVADHDTGDPVWIGEGRSQATVGKFFDELGAARAENLGAISMDMCASYILEAKARAPQAEIAFDPFHVVKLANEAVHDVRRTEARERKGSEQAAVLKGSRWALLKAPEHLRAEERVRLSAVAGLNARVYRAYLLKEELRALYRCGPRAAPEHLRSWIAWASRSKLRPFVKLGRTLRLYRDGVLAAIRLRLSNGRMEGLNNKIGVIKHRAYGFHSFAALAAMVFLCCIDLQLKLPI